MNHRPESEPVGTSSSLTLTLAGRVTFVVALTAIVSGWLAGLTESYALGAAAATALAVSLTRAVVQRPHLAVSSRTTPHKAMVGETFEMVVTLDNESRRRSTPVAVDIPIDGIPRRTMSIPPIDGHSGMGVRLSIDATKRGEIEVGATTYTQMDPFRLVERVTTATGSHQLTVWPLIWQLDVAPDTVVGHGGALPSPKHPLVADSDEFSTLGEYAPGDDLRHIHWPSSARAGHLVVRRFENQQPRHTHIVLERYADNHASFEVSVAICASVIVALDSPDDTVSLTTATVDHAMTAAGRANRRVAPITDVDACMDALAVVRPETRIPRDIDGSGRRTVDRRIAAILAAMDERAMSAVDRVIVIGTPWSASPNGDNPATIIRQALPTRPGVRLIGVPPSSSMPSTDQQSAQRIVDGHRTVPVMARPTQSSPLVRGEVDG